ncbi:hypothetical protein ILUMI_18523, partial [Ignelater luminosus]
ATIMKKKAKLKQIKERKVYINDDLSPIEREKQKQIGRKTNEEKGNGKDVNIGYNKVIIDRNIPRWEKKKKDKPMCKVMKKAKIDKAAISEKERISKNSYLKIGTWKTSSEKLGDLQTVYFEELLNGEEEQRERYGEFDEDLCEEPTLEHETSPPSLEEMKEIIKNLKSNKSPGEDGVLNCRDD